MDKEAGAQTGSQEGAILDVELCPGQVWLETWVVVSLKQADIGFGILRNLYLVEEGGKEGLLSKRDVNISSAPRRYYEKD